MKRLTAAACAAFAAVLAGCGSPNAAVSTASFHFADYDYVVVAKPAASDSALYGMDVSLANLLEAHGLTSIGDKAFAQLTPPEQRRTLDARLALVSNNDNKNLLAVSFDDAVSGKTGVSISEVAKGDMFDNGDRRKAFVKLTQAIELALKPEAAALASKAAAKTAASQVAVQSAERVPATEPPPPVELKTQ